MTNTTDIVLSATPGRTRCGVLAPAYSAALPDSLTVKHYTLTKQHRTALGTGSPLRRIPLKPMDAAPSGCLKTAALALLPFRICKPGSRGQRPYKRLPAITCLYVGTYDRSRIKNRDGAGVAGLDFSLCNYLLLKALALSFQNPTPLSSAATAAGLPALKTGNVYIHRTMGRCCPVVFMVVND